MDKPLKQTRNLQGWHKDREDIFGTDFNATKIPAFFQLVRKAAAAPAAYDMRPNMPPVYDQKTFGSCVFNACNGAVQFTEKEVVSYQKRPVPSRFFGYYNARMEQGNVQEDGGSTIRMGMKVLAKYGYVSETLWPYVAANFAKKPPKTIYDAAGKHRLGQMMYAKVPQTKTAIMWMLANNNPIAYGFTVYESFDSVKKDGKVPMPKKGESVRGGHAMLIVGYDQNGVIVRNSWGSMWGDKGHCYKSWDFILSKICSDFWTITGVPTLENVQVSSEAA